MTAEAIVTPSTSNAPLLTESDGVLACAECVTPLASQADVVSKAFQGRHGRAYLVKKVVNIKTGEPQERLLITGLHIVADINCVTCNVVVGWKYLRAYEENQRFKEGKFILERGKLAKDNRWM